MVLVLLMLLQCHQDSAQFNIVSVLLDIICKHNLKRLLNSFEFFLFNLIVKLQKRYENVLSYFQLCGKGYQNFLKDHVGVPKPFARCFRGSKTFLTPQKSLRLWYSA